MAHTHIYVWDRLVLSAGLARENSSHRHFGAILTVAHDAPMSLTSRDAEPVVARAVVVAPNAWHRVEACNGRAASILIGPDHPWFGYVKPVLNGEPIVPLDVAALSSGTVIWDDLFEGRSDCAQALRTVQRILQAFGKADAPSHRLDARIGAVLQMLQGGGSETPAPDELGRHVGLSGFSLMRLFKAELGVRIREYVLWRRLMFALTLVDGRSTIAEIALRTGFYDQAHLTRTVRRMVELAPSIINDFSQTRVHVCPGCQ